jgi:hypothetical protein
MEKEKYVPKKFKVFAKIELDVTVEVEAECAEEAEEHLSGWSPDSLIDAGCVESESVDIEYAEEVLAKPAKKPGKKRPSATT